MRRQLLIFGLIASLLLITSYLLFSHLLHRYLVPYLFPHNNGNNINGGGERASWSIFDHILHEYMNQTSSSSSSQIISPTLTNNNNNNTNTTLNGDETNTSFLSLILKQNYLFLMTGLLGLFTSLFSLLYWTCTQVTHQLSKQFITSISLNNSDEAFTWLMTYLGNQHTLYHSSKKKNSKIQNSTKNTKKNDENEEDENLDELNLEERLEASFLTAPSLVAQMVRIKRMNYWNRLKGVDDGQAIHVQYLPEDGFHVFCFRGKYFWFTKTKNNDAVSTGYDKNSSFTFESLTLNMFGSLKSVQNQQVLLALFDEAMKSSMTNSSDVLKIYVARQWSGWSLALAKNKRPFSSVILDRDLGERLAQDAIQFLGRREWYREKGIPFRRGYLLYGLPGTGKSSLVSALASRLNLNICVLDLSSGLIGDEELAQRMQSAPPRSVILLEDIDAVFTNRNTPDANRNKRSVTFAGLLNSIDGIAAPESGRLLFMTTNHIERLDPALIRPGRCDVKVEFTYATRQQMREAFLHFYKEATTDQAERFCVAIETEGEQLTMAQVLSHLSRFKRDPEASIANVKDGFIKRIRQYTLEERNISAATIEEWLKRLGFSKQIQAFRRDKVQTVLDLGPTPKTGLFTQRGVSAFGDVERVSRVLQNEKAAMADFQNVTPGEVKRLFKFHFVGVPDAIVKRLITRLGNLELSFMELKQYFNAFKQQYYTSAPNERLDVLEQMLNKVDEHLVHPPQHHLNVPAPSDLVNIHTGEVCSVLNESTDLFDYCPKQVMQSARDWIQELNNEYKWWSNTTTTSNTDSTTTTTTTTETTTTKAPVVEPTEKTSSSSTTDTSTQTNGTDAVGEKEEPKKKKKNDDSSKEEEDSTKEDEAVEGLETIFKVFDDEGVVTVKDMLTVGAIDDESTWEDKFKVRAKGRRLRIVRRVKQVQKVVEEFTEVQKNWAQLFQTV